MLLTDVFRYTRNTILTVHRKRVFKSEAFVVRLQGVERQGEGVLEPGGPRHRGVGVERRARAQGQRERAVARAAGAVPAPRRPG